jgi:hypothetical protein
VGGFGEVDGDVELSGEDAEAGDVVLVLVSDDDGVEGGRVFSGEVHASDEFAAGEPGVDQYTGV